MIIMDWGEMKSSFPFLLIYPEKIIEPVKKCPGEALSYIYNKENQNSK